MENNYFIVLDDVLHIYFDASQYDYILFSLLMSEIMLYFFLQSTSVLQFNIDVV